MSTPTGLYAVRDVARIFGINESRVRYWAQTGFINPSGARAGRRLYTFRDLVAVRAAVELLERGVPLQRVRKNLQALREALPELAQPLSALRIRSDGEQLVVAEDGVAFEPVSGQVVLDFEIQDLHSQVVELMGGPRRPAEERRAPAPVTPVSSEPEPATAYGWFLRGCACDGATETEEEALRAFSRAIELDAGLAAAHTNLGNLYYRRGARDEARRSYEQACALDPDQPHAHYNLANLYEEDGELDRAIAEYRRALAQAPEFADAHFNLALTLERVGSRVQALTHWRRYLELSHGEMAQGEDWLVLAQERVEQLSRSD